MNKKKMIIIIIIAVVAISIGLYTIPPLFTNTVVEEPLPTASGFSLCTCHSEIFMNKPNDKLFLFISFWNNV